MFELIAGGMSSLSAALDLAKGLNATVTEARIAEVKLELGRHIMEAQQALATAHQTETANLKRIDALEQRVTELVDWSAERQRYELVEIGPGVFAYMQKAGMRSPEPAHWLCANCFGHNKKSILQKQGTDGERIRPVSCPECRFAFSIHWQKVPKYEGAA